MELTRSNPPKSPKSKQINFSVIFEKLESFKNVPLNIGTIYQAGLVIIGWKQEHSLWRLDFPYN